MARQKWTDENIIKYVEEQGFQFIGFVEGENGKGRKSKIIVRCNQGHEPHTRVLDTFILSRCKCIDCSNELMRKERQMNFQDIQQYIENFGYQILTTESEYTNSRMKLKLICDKGHECFINWDNFKNERRCRTCRDLQFSQERRLGYADVKQVIEDNGHKLLSETYINSHTELEIQCQHGHVFNRTYDHYRQRKNCPLCKTPTKGEAIIINFLNQKNIDFIYDSAYFEDLLSPLGNPLRPDFILPTLKIWIEYDGEFHYNNVYDEGEYKKLIKHDKIKDDYAKRNNWNLIRIPYWDFDNIEEILYKNIIQHE